MIITILVVIFNIFLLIFPQIVLAAARDGLMLWFNNVLPSLLPFMIATNMLILLGFVGLVGAVLSPVMRVLFKLPGAAGFGLITGLTSGYPMGAKTVADLKRAGQLSTGEAQHLLAFSNNAGPLFILGVVGIGLFSSARFGYVLWAAHVLAALILGVILRPAEGREHSEFEPGKVKESFWKYRSISGAQTPGRVLGEAVKNAMESITFVGGLIIFFSVVVAVVQNLGLPDSPFFGVLAGIIEVTGGVRQMATQDSSLNLRGSVAFIVAFGGFSVHAQSFHFTEGTGIKVVPYLLAKALHGVIAATLTVILWSFLQ